VAAAPSPANGSAPETGSAQPPPAPESAKPAADKSVAAAPAVASTPGTTVPAAAEARATTGTLVLKVVPWANVFIDGKSRGQVEGRRAFSQLSAGPHHIKLSQPIGERELDVVIPAGGSVTKDVNLLSR
jgi:hypothetical protein